MNNSNRIEAFISECQTNLNAHQAKYFPNSTVPVLTVEPGRKYARIVKATSELSRSVFGFVDMETGNLYKAASWKAPAKGCRGNIDKAPCAAWIYGIS